MSISSMAQVSSLSLSTFAVSLSGMKCGTPMQRFGSSQHYQQWTEGALRRGIRDADEGRLARSKTLSGESMPIPRDGLRKMSLKVRRARLCIHDSYGLPTGNSVSSRCISKMPTYRVGEEQRKCAFFGQFGRGISGEYPGKGPDGRRSREHRGRIRASETDSGSRQNGIVEKAAETLHLAVSFAAFLALDKFLKEQFLAAGIRFPSALFGMFCIFTLLNAADAIKPEAAAAIVSFFQPGISFIQRWLPLFYVPSLVVVPLAVKGIPTTAAAKIAIIFVVGWAATLAVAGYTAVAVRSIVKTEMEPAAYTPKPSPFADWEIKALAFAGVLSFAFAVYSPSALGTIAKTASPFFVFVTALGYMVGSRMPTDFKTVLHPIITCALTANLACFVYGSVTKIGYEDALKTYLTKQQSNLGAGDLFMGVLGSVILSFAFSMFNQRKLVKRHASEIFSAVVAAGVFSMYSTAAVGRLLGLPSGLTLAIVPRCITVALALPVASLLEASNPSLTAAVVVLTGLVGANFTQLVMDKLGFGDPISRGMATATSAHGLGTAALSAKEPEALPFCAIAYALNGIFCSVLASIPAVQRSLIFLAGSV